MVVTATATASKVDAVAQSRRSDVALTTATATFLALKIAESNIKAAIAGKTNRRHFDNFVFDVFAESDYEPKALTPRRRRHQRTLSNSVLGLHGLRDFLLWKDRKRSCTMTGLGFRRKSYHWLNAAVGTNHRLT